MRHGDSTEREVRSKHVSAAEIHRQIVEVYGEEVTSCQSVEEGCSDVKSSRVGTMDNEGCCRPSESRSASGGQLWNIRHTGHIWSAVIFTCFPLLRVILLATNWQLTTTWKQLLRVGWNRRAQNSRRHELTNQSQNCKNASILVGQFWKIQ